MLCRITDLHSKEVINVSDGRRLGYIDDVEVDTCTAQLVSLIIFGHAKLCGILGRTDEIVIGWKEIEVIGPETVLVHHDCPCDAPSCRRSLLGGIFGKR